MEGARERNGNNNEPRRGFGLFCQQFRALMKKNFLLSWRNKPSMIMQLTASFVFVFLIFCAQKAFASRLKFTTLYDNIYDPKYKLVGSILPCEDGFFIKAPCYDFVWSGRSSSGISDIVKSIMANNPGRAIPPSKVKGFPTPADVDEWLAANPMRCTGALHFHLGNSSSTVQRLGYGIQINSTSRRKRGYYEDHTLKFQIPLQVAAEREIARYLLGGKEKRKQTDFQRQDWNWKWALGKFWNQKKW